MKKINMDDIMTIAEESAYIIMLTIAICLAMMGLAGIVMSYCGWVGVLIYFTIISIAGTLYRSSYCD